MPDETTLQEQFYEELCKIDGTIADISGNTDGVIRGTIIENKLKIDNPAVPLSQAIAYLSKFRNLAKDIPGHIMTVDFSRKHIRIYNSEDFLDEIEKPHLLAASKSNRGFVTDKKPISEYSYDKNLIQVVNDLKYDKFIKVHIDFFNIVANSQRFYNQILGQKKKKLAFRKELLSPKVLNIYPIPEKELKEKEKSEFAGVIDCLNDKLLQKELGAFYTPDPYVKLSTQMVRDAIKHIKQESPNNDYIILDRCAGTGNLEKFLTDKNVSDITLEELKNYIPEELYIKYLKDKSTCIKIIDKPLGKITIHELEEYKTNIAITDYIFDNELSHCILSTYETWEWTILNAKYADKVRMIIPPEGTINKYEPFVIGANALSEAFITGNESLNIFGNLETDSAYLESIRTLNKYVASKNCNIILYENPPFRNSSLDSSNGTAFVQDNYVYSFMHDSDLSNQFIWSGWEYYLKKKNDFFVLYSPIKYWKTNTLSEKKLIKGYVFNRDFFGEAGPSAITCIQWKNEADSQNTISLDVYDIVGEDGKSLYKIGKIHKFSDTDITKYIKTLDIKKVFHDISEYYDKTNETNKSVVSGYDGYEDLRNKNKSRDYKDYVGYLIARYYSYELPRQNCCLLRTTHYRNGGFAITEDNLVEKLPLFVCGRNDEVEQTWFLNGTVFKSSDGHGTYTKDKNFLKKCLIYTCLTDRNHSISFMGSDGRFYRNELCLGQNTIADKKLQKFNLDQKDKAVIKEWVDVLDVVKETSEYQTLLQQFPDVTLGLHQIEQEIDVYEYKGTTYNKKEKNELVKNLDDKDKKLVLHKYPNLVKEIEDLKLVLKKYYTEEINDDLFKYELLK